MPPPLSNNVSARGRGAQGTLADAKPQVPTLRSKLSFAKLRAAVLPSAAPSRHYSGSSHSSFFDDPSPAPSEVSASPVAPVHARVAPQLVQFPRAPFRGANISSPEPAGDGAAAPSGPPLIDLEQARSLDVARRQRGEAPASLDYRWDGYPGLPRSPSLGANRATRPGAAGGRAPSATSQRSTTPTSPTSGRPPERPPRPDSRDCPPALDRPLYSPTASYLGQAASGDLATPPLAHRGGSFSSSQRTVRSPSASSSSGQPPAEFVGNQVRQSSPDTIQRHSSELPYLQATDAAPGSADELAPGPAADLPSPRSSRRRDGPNAARPIDQAPTRWTPSPAPPATPPVEAKQRQALQALASRVQAVQRDCDRHYLVLIGLRAWARLNAPHGAAPFGTDARKTLLAAAWDLLKAEGIGKLARHCDCSRPEADNFASDAYAASLDIHNNGTFSELQPALSATRKALRLHAGLPKPASSEPLAAHKAEKWLHVGFLLAQALGVDPRSDLEVVRAMHRGVPSVEPLLSQSMLLAIFVELPRMQDGSMDLIKLCGRFLHTLPEAPPCF